MRWLINYIRNCFCKHEWEQLKEVPVYYTDFTGKCSELPSRYIISYRCKKCGMVQKIKIQ